MTKILLGNSLRWRSKFARVLTVLRGLIAIFRVRNCKIVHLFTINMLMVFVSYHKIDVGIQNICCSEFPSWHLVRPGRILTPCACVRVCTYVQVQMHTLISNVQTSQQLPFGFSKKLNSNFTII